VDIYLDGNGVGGVLAPDSVGISDGTHPHTFAV
jgi:hypothetical protein